MRLALALSCLGLGYLEHRIMKLYDYELSGNCYKVRLLLHFLRVPCERISVDFFPGKEHKGEAFLRDINPLGQLPVIDDAGFLLRDAQAILTYLASKYDDSGQWYPDSPQLRGQIQIWLGVAEDITRTASAARLHDALGYSHIDVAACRDGARSVFRVLDNHLAERQMLGAQWLVGDTPTIADIACFPYVALSAEGGISLTEFPAIRQWAWAFRSRKGFIGMAGIMPMELTD